MTTTLEIAIVANIRATGELTPKLIGVYSVADREEAFALVAREITAELNPKNITMLEDEKQLSTLPVGTYAVVPAGCKYNIWLATEKVDVGYIWNAVAVDIINLGYFMLVFDPPNVLTEMKSKYASTMDELQRRVESLTVRADTLDCENVTLRQALTSADTSLCESRKLYQARSEDCKRLLAELDFLRSTNNKDLDAILALNAEISDLQRRLAEKEKEVTSLREDAKYAVRTGSTPTKILARDNPVYTQCIAAIQDFNMATLLTRDERDAILAKKRLGGL